MIHIMRFFLFSLLLALSFPVAMAAQQPFEGTIRYLKVTNWAKQFASLDYMSQQQKDRMSYMWGSRSEWKTFCVLTLNATESKYEDSEERAEPDDDGFSWRRDPFAVRRHFEKQTMQDLLTLAGKSYVVEDSLNPPQWKILNDLKEVSGHICMNAFWEDTVKKQKVVAWFALDIPQGAGPERFYGLPGLILEVNVNDGAMVVTADKFEAKPVGEALAPPKKLKGKKIKEADYRRELALFIENKRKEEEPYFWGMRY